MVCVRKNESRGFRAPTTRGREEGRDIPTGLNHWPYEKETIKSTFTMQADYGATWDHYPIFARIEEQDVKFFQKKKRNQKWTGWKPISDERLVLLRREVMKKGEGEEEVLSTIQKNIENAALKMKHRTNAQKEKDMMRTQ